MLPLSKLDMVHLVGPRIVMILGVVVFAIVLIASAGAQDSPGADGGSFMERQTEYLRRTSLAEERQARALEDIARNLGRCR